MFANESQFENSTFFIVYYQINEINVPTFINNYTFNKPFIEMRIEFKMYSIKFLQLSMHFKIQKQYYISYISTITILYNCGKNITNVQQS